MSAHSFVVLCQKIDAQLFELFNHMICLICQKLFLKPVLISCGHSFCLKCIKEVLSSQNNNGCPICRCIIRKNCLESNTAKFTISEICKELANAFLKDVKDGCKFFKYSENDLLSALNTQLLYESRQQEVVSKKRKIIFIDFSEQNNLENIQIKKNDSENFTSNLKKSKNMESYKTKKKKTDNFTSPKESHSLPNCDIYSVPKNQNELQRLKKSFTNENEYFKSTKINELSKNLFSLNFFQTNKEKCNGMDISFDKKPKKEIKLESIKSMIRVDYKKPNSPMVSPINERELSDSYKFLTNQNSDVLKKPNNLKKEHKESECQRNQKGHINKSITKKKSNLVLKKNNNKKRSKNSTSEFSTKTKTIKRKKIPCSVLDESYIQIMNYKTHLKTEGKNKSANVSYSLKKKNNEKKSEDNIFNSFFKPVNKVSSGKNSLKKEHEFNVKNVKEENFLRNQTNTNEEKFFKNLVGLKNDDAIHLEESVEKYLTKFTKKENDIAQYTIKTKSFKKNKKEHNKALLNILEEMVLDETIYSNYAKNVSIKFSKKNLREVCESRIQKKKYTINKNFCVDCSKFSKKSKKFLNSNFKELRLPQSSDSIGFRLNKEIREENKVQKINKKTDLEFQTFSNSNFIQNINNFDETWINLQYNKKPELIVSKKTSLKLLNNNKINKVNEKIIKKVKASFINFLLLGRLTPSTKRSKSSVVKLVFPVGLNSFIKKHTFSSKLATKMETSRSFFHPFRSFDCNCQSKNILDFAPVTSLEIQTKGNTTSEVYQSSEKKNFFLERQTFQNNSQNKKNEKTAKQSITTSSSPENKFVSFKASNTQSFLRNEIINVAENDSASKTEIKNLKHQQENLSLPNETSKNDFLLKTLKNNSYVMENEISSLSENLVEEKNFQNEKLKPTAYILPNFSDDNSSNCIEKDLLNEKISPSNYFEQKKKFDTLTSINLQQNDNNYINNKTINEQILNTDLDGMGFSVQEKIKEKSNQEKNFYENSEESDSDFFVEQTPPSLINSRKEKKHLKKNESTNVFSEKKDKSNFECSFDKRNLEEENLMNEIWKQNRIENNNMSSVNFIEQGIKMLTSNENINYEKFEINSQKDYEKLNLERFKHFSQKTFFSNIQAYNRFLDSKPNENDQNEGNAYIECRNDCIKVDFEERSTEVDFLKTDENVFYKKEICIVASSVKNLETIKNFAKKFKIQFLDKPSKSMTHLIVGLHENEDNEMLPLCTPKLLFALANKKWVISELWAETCIKVNKILPEETFETYDPVGGHGCRTARLSQDFLLENCEIYLLGNFETMSKNELADLILDCGGTLILQPEKFSYSPTKIRMIIVDKDCLSNDEEYLKGLYEKYRSIVLSRDAIIMSLQTYTLCNFLPYLMHASSTEDLVRMGYPLFLVKQEESAIL